MIYVEQLHELLDYDPETGVFTNRIWRGTRGAVGEVAGSYDKDGYIVIQIKGRKYRAGRLAWLYMTGKWPEYEIDHEDGNYANDAWSNLREATRCDNMSNASRPLGESGLRGVNFDPRTRTWRARIGYGNDRQWLGPFNTAEEASTAYLAAAESVHGKFAFHNRTPQETN